MDKARLTAKTLGRSLSGEAGPCLIVGVDPSTTCCAVASVWLSLKDGKITPARGGFLVVRGGGRKDMGPMRLGLANELSALTEAAALVLVEDQKVRESGKGKTKNPENLIPLAQVAGMAALASSLADEVEFVQPHVWKGSTDKVSNHLKTLRDLGWEGRTMSGYVIPSHWDTIEVRSTDGKHHKSDWKELMDALGIALWGAREVWTAKRTAQLLSGGGGPSHPEPGPDEDVTGGPCHLSVRT